MRTQTTLSHRLRLATTATACLSAAALAGCSADAIRFEEALGSSLTTASTMTPNQHAIIHGQGATAAKPTTVNRFSRPSAAPTASLEPAPALPAAAPVSVSRSPLGAATSGSATTANTSPRKPLYVLPPVAETAPTEAGRDTFRTAASAPAAKPGQLVLAPRVANAEQHRTFTGSVSSQPAPIVAAAKGAGWNGTKGTSVVLKSGETLHNLSRRYGVPVRAIKAANGIDDASNVAAGTTVLIPTYTYGSTAQISAPDSNSLTRISRSSKGFQGQARSVVPTPKYRLPTSRTTQQAPLETVAANAPVATTGGQFHTVLSGQTLYAISRKYNVRMDALRLANNLSKDGLRVGQKLIVPGEGFTAAAADAATTASVAPAANTASRAEIERPAPEPVAKTAEPVRTASTAKPSAPVVKSRFQWPASGTILARFGAPTPGGANDGIDIAVPSGTPVRAARGGTVIYSGSELQDFGKLVLLSHAGGFVTAYAHASDVLVKRGQVIKAGQVIAKSGATGNATQPKLHFEIRQNSKPVNPLLHLPK